MTRRFSTYDFEWVPKTMKIRVCGVYDDVDGYRAYTTVPEFLDAEMNSDSRGRWFYAHAGGLADMIFVLHELAKREGYEVKAAFSGSSAIIVNVKRGKNSWHFIDSFWLLRDKLRNIAKWVGMTKGNEEESEEFYATAPLSTLIEYNAVDCEILWKAIHAFQNEILRLGGQLQMTQASTAMQLFRRKFLHREIETNGALNMTARGSYFGSRVEVFQQQCEDASYYDINSSFPFAMTSPCPGDLKRTEKGLPAWCGPGSGWLTMSDLTVEVPDTYLPPLPLKHDGRVFFPVGKWRGWFNNIDVELLLSEGGRIREAHETMVFEPFTDLCDYALTLYDMRKKSTSDFEKIVLKLLMNSLYGKFAESTEKTALYLHPNKTFFDRWEQAFADGETEKLPKMLFPGAFLVTSVVPVTHAHVPISSHITALARRNLYKHLSKCSEIHYCDTDGFSTKDPDLQTGLDLGALKLEKRIAKATFAAPKVYEMERVPGSFDPEKEEGTITRAKGFSKMTPARFQALLDNEEIGISRMVRIRELYRAGKTEAAEKMIMKRLQHEGMGKRSMYPDGRTRPWSVDEVFAWKDGQSGVAGKFPKKGMTASIPLLA
jgi:hypothetical protein